MGIWIYAGCLALGGVLLLASLFLGKIDLDGDGTPDIHVDHGYGDHAHGGEHTTGTALIAALTSIRFWTFFLTFFGLVGVVLTGFGLAGTVGTALAAVGMGLATGAGIALTMRRLASTPDSAARADDYIGKTARVLVPVKRLGVGKVRVQVKGTTVDLLATTDDDVDLATTDEVLVVEMEGTRAKVSRVKD